MFVDEQARGCHSTLRPAAPCRYDAQVQVRARRPCFAAIEAPSVRFRANFRNGPCSKQRSVGAPRLLRCWNFDSCRLLTPLGANQRRCDHQHPTQIQDRANFPAVFGQIWENSDQRWKRWGNTCGGNWLT